MLSIDGAPTEGWDGDRAAKSLRGRQGSSVMVKFARRSSQVPGVAGRPEQPPRVEFTQVMHGRPRVHSSPCCRLVSCVEFSHVVGSSVAETAYCMVLPRVLRMLACRPLPVPCAVAAGLVVV